jgi:hypothetical protein
MGNVKIRKVLFGVLFVFMSMLPMTAQAADFPSVSFSEPYAASGSLYASLNLTGGDVANRGGGANTVFGPLLTLKSGTNRVLSVMLSTGAAVGPSETPTDQTFGGSVGIGPCVMNDAFCVHGGYKVDFNTGQRHRQLLFLGRILTF